MASRRKPERINAAVAGLADRLAQDTLSAAERAEIAAVLSDAAEAVLVAPKAHVDDVDDDDPWDRVCVRLQGLIAGAAN